MTKNAMRGNNRSEVRSYNLEVSRSPSRRKRETLEPKRYAVKAVNAPEKPRNSRKASPQTKKQGVPTAKQSKKVANRQTRPPQGSVFKYLTVIMTTIILFGSLGFGFTLRYAHQWQQMNPEDRLSDESLTDGRDVMGDDNLRESRFGN